MTGALLFVPLYRKRPWGGRALEPAFGRTLPPAQTIGESWEIVDRPKEQSVVVRGPHAGRTLRQLIERERAAIMGPGWDPGQRFPILVKWLDCRERLSLQVHPPAAVAATLKGEPKTENWYIARAEPHAALIVGLRRVVTRAEFERAIAAGTLEALVHRFPVRAGDSMFVPSGRVHAIDGGNLILEIQQNSDTTYRVYDWGRVDAHGNTRELHVEKSLQCIDFADVEPAVLRPAAGSDVTLAECREFRIRRCERQAGEDIALQADPPEARLLSVVRGSVRVSSEAGSDRFVAGDTALLPAATPFRATADEDTTVLVTDGFSGR